MTKLQKSSIILLSICGLLGLVRGTRMTFYEGDDSLFFAYPQEMMKASVFSTYSILGWIVFVLVGLFSLIAIASIIYKMRNYAYFIIVEGIFASFFSITHVLYAGFSLIHLVIIPICIAIIILGILQTPREF